MEYSDDVELSSALDFITKQRERRQSNKVLHAHPSPLFWTDRAPPIHEILTKRRDTSEVARFLNLYIATPYCIRTEPERCGFCLFPSEDFRGQEQLATYLRYLEREGELMRPYYEGARIKSVYFGGGTSNLYRPHDYAQLMKIVRDVVRLPHGIEITLEGIPQLFTRDKLVAMKDAGVTRVSIGAQQLDDEMIKLSGRKQTAEQVLNTLAWCEELGLETSVDLIFGWPGQSVERMLSDLQTLVDTGLRHLTHYELNVAGRSDFARNHRDTLPSIQQNREMYFTAKSFLEEHGFRQRTAYDWERAAPDRVGAEKYVFEENMRRMFYLDDGGVGCNACIGWGFAGVSIDLGTPSSTGWSTLNATRVQDYFDMLDRGQFPIERAFQHSAEDVRMCYIFQCLQGLRVDPREYKTLFGLDLLDEHRAAWQALERVGWVTLAPGAIEVVGEGVFFLAVVQSLLGARQVEALRRSSSARSADSSVGSRLVQVRTPPRKAVDDEPLKQP